MALWTPPVIPSSGTGRTAKTDRYESRFGEGYSQRVERGINSERLELTVRWDILTHADADTIEGYLRSVLGLTAFDMVIPPDSTTTQVVCEDVDRSELYQNASAIVAKLVRVYDL